MAVINNSQIIEWMSLRASQLYPFADSVLNIIPKDLILDLSILIPPTLQLAALDIFYIKNIVVYDTTLSIDLWYKDSSVDFCCGIFSGISRDLSITNNQDASNYFILSTSKTVPSGYEWITKLTAKIFVGNTASYNLGTQQLTYLTGKLNPVCTHLPSFSGVNNFICDNTIISGDINLVAGSGIKLEADSLSNTIYISIDYNTIFQDMNTIDQALTKIYLTLGTPIKRINGITPDNSGNILLSGIDCVLVKLLTQGAITISDKCSKPCCTNIATDDITNAISILQTLHLTLKGYFTEQANNINFMQANMATILGSK